MTVTSGASNPQIRVVRGTNRSIPKLRVRVRFPSPALCHPLHEENPRLAGVLDITFDLAQVAWAPNGENPAQTDYQT
jgi:hypothetical protein